MATNEPNKPDNVINIDTAKTQAEEKTAPDQPVQAGGDAPAPEKTTGQDQAVTTPAPEDKAPEKTAAPDKAAPEKKAPEPVKQAARKGRPPKSEKVEKEPKPEKTPKKEKTVQPKKATAKEETSAPEPEQPPVPREGGGYEIIAGHRRQKASEMAGYANMPCIVRQMTDDEAILAMTDDNLRQRSEILPLCCLLCLEDQLF